MNQNQQVGMSNGYPMPTQKQGFKLEIPQQDKKLYIGFIACVVLLAIGCFLPFSTMEAKNFSMNYISYDGRIKDGVIVIALSVIAVYLLLKNKHILSIISYGIGVAIFAIDTFNVLDSMKKYRQDTLGLLPDSYKLKFGIGFYLVLIFLILGAIFLLLLLKKRKTTVQPVSQAPIPNPVAQPVANPNPQYGYPQATQVPTQQYCPYCRTPKNPGSTFCNNCGAKF